MTAPIRRERPTFPEGYGLPDTDDGLLEWSTVEARLIEAKHYWLATVRPDGQHAVVLEGRSVATRADADGLGARLEAAFAKYHDDGYRPGADAWAAEHGGGLRVFTPVTALAWFSFPTDATRFRFAP